MCPSTNLPIWEHKMCVKPGIGSGVGVGGELVGEKGIFIGLAKQSFSFSGPPINIFVPSSKILSQLYEQCNIVGLY